MEQSVDDPMDWRVVVTIHGIRTTGRWQKEIGLPLTHARLQHMPLDFGFFPAISLLLPWVRSRKVEWFHHVYNERISKTDQLPCLIAHSFGSYIVAKSMLKYSDIRFDRIILCGSIISRDFPWSKIFQRRQCNSVLNECGKKDKWVRVVEFVVDDAGPSGAHGFIDDANGLILQNIQYHHRHSDYFYKLNYNNRWIPYLKGGNIDEVAGVHFRSRNWKFRFLVFFLISVLAGIFCASFFSYFDSYGVKKKSNIPVEKDVKEWGFVGEGFEKSNDQVRALKVIDQEKNAQTTRGRKGSIKKNDSLRRRVGVSVFGRAFPGSDKPVIRDKSVAQDRPVIESPAGYKVPPSESARRSGGGSEFFCKSNDLFKIEDMIVYGGYQSYCLGSMVMSCDEKKVVVTASAFSCETKISLKGFSETPLSGRALDCRGGELFLDGELVYPSKTSYCLSAGKALRCVANKLFIDDKAAAECK